MDPLAGMDDESSTDDENASQNSESTEDDPQVPEQAQAIQAPASAPSAISLPPAPVTAPPQSTGTARERPRYEARHTLRGHTASISAVKFSPDGQLLASCGRFSCNMEDGPGTELHRKPTISSSRFGTHIRASSSATWLGTQRVSRTLHGQAIVFTLHLHQTIRWSDFGT
jgi:WD40 repeat protein